MSSALACDCKDEERAYLSNGDAIRDAGDSVCNEAQLASKPDSRADRRAYKITTGSAGRAARRSRSSSGRQFVQRDAVETESVSRQTHPRPAPRAPSASRSPNRPPAASSPARAPARATRWQQRRRIRLARERTVAAEHRVGVESSARDRGRRESAASRRSACWSAPRARARRQRLEHRRDAVVRTRVLQQPLVVEREIALERVGRHARRRSP